MAGYEEARKNLGELRDWFQENDRESSRNEATTRLHLIDNLLFDCLGWNREDCDAEERLENTYADYSLGRPARRLVVEAKREGTYFELPAGWDSPSADIETLGENNPKIADAIRQAVEYCQQRGIPVGAVCNGHQLIAFLGSRQDGVPPLAGRALLFASLDDMLERFREFWNYLSKPGIETFRLQSILLAPAHPPPPEKLAAQIPSYPGFKSRSPQAQDLKILGDLVIQDIVDMPALEREFLEACYSKTGALSQYALVSREILQTRYSLLFQREAEVNHQPAAQKKGLSKALSEDIVAAALSRRPILLIGDVGVGKTMFIRQLVEVEVNDLVDRAIVFRLDFAKEPALAKDVEAFIMKQFEIQLREKYDIDVEDAMFVRGVYHGDLERFKRGIYSPLQEEDPAEFRRQELRYLADKLEGKPGHLRASLQHASKAQSRQVIVFLDNMDQRPPEFQEQLFPVAQSLAETWPMTVFVSLRPETFYRSRERGTLSAYQPRVFTIPPPRVDRVIVKRLSFAKSLLEEEGRLPSFPEGFTVDSSMLIEFIDVLISAFEENDELLEFVENLSGGNVRRALGFVNSFVGSGHVNTRRILEVLQRGQEYVLPLFQFMSAVIYGDHEYYDPAASPVANLFDISSPEGKEHFLLSLLLSFVERSGSNGGGEGYVMVQGLYEYAQRLGFQPHQIDNQIERAREKDLLDFGHHFTEDLPDRCRITPEGAYHLQRLLRSFTYVDAMVVDTPIIDDAVRSRITDARSTLDRVHRAEVFRGYLDDQWEPLADSRSVFDWLAASDQLRRDILRVRRRVEAHLAEPEVDSR